ncbi:MAG TPA: AAA family ATPase [Xanthobacteraceae bacterium]|nr:AAA family ATPase [Xanthobacteraceae bacterium]
MTELPSRPCAATGDVCPDLIDFIFRTSDPINPDDPAQVAAAEAREKIAETRAADFAAPNPDIAEVLEFARWHAANTDRRHFHWSALAYDLRRRYGDHGRALFDAGLDGYPAPGRATYRDEVWANALRHPDGEKPHSYHPEPRPHYCDESLVTRMRAWRKDQEIAKRVDGIKAAALAQAQFAEDMKAGKIPGPVGYKEESSMAHASAAPIVKSAATLRERQFEPVKYVVPSYVAEGLTILAGRPKIGKSWWTLDGGLAVASGGTFLGTKVEQGDVLALMLEDNERRLKNRIGKVLGPFADWPARFTYATEWPRVDEGGIDRIREWVESVPQPRLVIVDVLARVRPLQPGRQAQYDADYQTIAGLQALAGQKGVGIIVVHHLRKSASESGDAIDKISGTLGLAGAADSLLVIDRDGTGTTMYARGRDIEEIETAIEFDRTRCRWQVLGAATEVRRSDERKRILDALQGASEAMPPADIAATTGMPANNVRYLLFKMVRDGEVIRFGRGYLRNAPNAANALTPSQPIIPLPPLPPR